MPSLIAFLQLRAKAPETWMIGRGFFSFWNGLGAMLVYGSVSDFRFAFVLVDVIHFTCHLSFVKTMGFVGRFSNHPNWGLLNICLCPTSGDQAETSQNRQLFRLEMEDGISSEIWLRRSFNCKKSRLKNTWWYIHFPLTSIPVTPKNPGRFGSFFCWGFICWGFWSAHVEGRV